MSISRRSFVASLALAASARRLPALVTEQPGRAQTSFDPWLEVDSAALAHNASTIARLTSRQILAVVKNNAYGLGIATAAPLLERLDVIAGFAVVRPDEARALNAAAVRKPVLLMGPASDEEAEWLARRDVRLAAYTRADADRLIRLARSLGRPIDVHLYVDTGMHRMGMPVGDVAGWLDTPGLRSAVRIHGAFTELTEDADFDREQARRLRALADAARTKGISIGELHAASSDAVAKATSDTYLDLVRPGLALYGGYATAEAMGRAELRPAYRLKARVIRVDELQAGEGVSYHRRFVADKPTRIVTLAIGHVDGYPSGAVRGCEVLIRGALHPVVGTVSASHTIVAMDAGHPVSVGDEATLVGADHPSLHPNVVAQRSGWSEYNMFMHLNPSLARRVV